MALGDTGLEQGAPDNAASHKTDKHLQQSGETADSARAAESGAVDGDSVHFDADLQRLIDAWPTLPDDVRAGIVAML